MSTSSANLISAHIQYEKFEDIKERGNQNPYIEEEQTTQWPKEN